MKKIIAFIRTCIGLRSPIRIVYHWFLGVLAFLLSGNPARGMYIIGVTGTKGKTTTSTLIATALKQAGKKICLITTAQIWMDDEILENHTKMTMNSPFQLWKIIKKARSLGVTHLVLETSSHGIYYFRNFGIHYNAVLLTNISQDHLDLHGTMDHYVATKARLFRKEKDKICILPLDCPYFEIFQKASQECITYSMTQESDFKLHQIQNNLESSPPVKGDAGKAGGFTKNMITLFIQHSHTTTALTSRLVGTFNAENMLGAYALLHSIGIDDAIIQKSWHDFSGAPGRMERVTNTLCIDIIIDYAHTEASLRSVLETLRQPTNNDQQVLSSRTSGTVISTNDTGSIPEKDTHSNSPSSREGARGWVGNEKPRLILVFGATGDRDTTKREKMGKVAHELADIIILTDDDTYTESSEKIIEMVKKGIPRPLGDTFFIIPDRKQAIFQALEKATLGDIVLLAGKGCETMMITNNGPIPWSDKGCVEEFLESINS